MDRPPPAEPPEAEAGFLPLLFGKGNAFSYMYCILALFVASCDSFWFSSRGFRHAVRELPREVGMDSSRLEGCAFDNFTLTYESGHNTVIP